MFYFDVLKFPKITDKINRPIPIPMNEPFAKSGNFTKWLMICDVAITNIPIIIIIRAFFFGVLFVFFIFKAVGILVIVSKLLLQLSL